MIEVLTNATIYIISMMSQYINHIDDTDVTTKSTYCAFYTMSIISQFK